MREHKFVIANSKRPAYQIFHGAAHAFVKLLILSIDIIRFMKRFILIEQMIGISDHHEQEVRGLQRAEHIEADLFRIL